LGEGWGEEKGIVANGETKEREVGGRGTGYLMVSGVIMLVAGSV
jgi:hypothetical protein